jgi:cytochrome c biogenesis protein CcdA
MWFWLTIMSAALLDSVNPCAFSILFLTIAFLFSLGRSRQNILLVGLLYIAGIFAVYLAIGLGILQVLSFFNVPHGLAKIGAVVLIIFGVLELLENLIPNFPIKLQIPALAKPQIARIINRASLPAAFGLGIAVGAFEFPCTGGPYLFVLGLLHDQATFWSGFGYLVVYNFIFVLPLVVALVIVSNRLILGRLDEWRRRETKKAGIWIALLMIILGAVIFML